MSSTNKQDTPHQSPEVKNLFFKESKAHIWMSVKIMLLCFHRKM